MQWQQQTWGQWLLQCCRLCEQRSKWPSGCWGLHSAGGSSFHSTHTHTHTHTTHKQHYDNKRWCCISEVSANCLPAEGTVSTESTTTEGMNFSGVLWGLTPFGRFQRDKLNITLHHHCQGVKLKRKKIVARFNKQSTNQHLQHLLARIMDRMFFLKTRWLISGTSGDCSGCQWTSSGDYLYLSLFLHQLIDIRLRTTSVIRTGVNLSHCYALMKALCGQNMLPWLYKFHSTMN